MKISSDAWIKRADEILSRGHSGHYAAAGEVYQFAISMLSNLYGTDSPQMRAFRANAEAISKVQDSAPGQLFQLSQGVITNAKAELEAGLIGNLRVTVAGEVLAELVRLGKESLQNKSEEAKNVAAVLIAAAFEGVLRKLGEEFAGVSDRPKLEEVVTRLKASDELRGGQVHTASGYLKFRNDSLHADWSSVDRSQVEGCLLFVESLFEKHFS